MTPQPRDWHELAEKASKEMDPEKLELLIDELNRTLDATKGDDAKMRLNTGLGTAQINTRIKMTMIAGSTKTMAVAE
jgi:hypothetical protein